MGFDEPNCHRGSPMRSSLKLAAVGALAGASFLVASVGAEAAWHGGTSHPVAASHGTPHPGPVAAHDDRRMGGDFSRHGGGRDYGHHFGARYGAGYGPVEAAPNYAAPTYAVPTYAGGYATPIYSAPRAYAPQTYTRSYLVPTTVYQTVTRSYTVPVHSLWTLQRTHYVPVLSYKAVTTQVQVPVTTYQTYQRIEQVPTTVYREVRQTCTCSAGE